jgi:hypothetical protein
VKKLALFLAVASTAASCYKAPLEPLRLDGNMLTVDNQTSTDWNDVEVWVNTHYRVITKSVPAHSRFQAPLDTFVEGFGHRFDFKRQQVRDVRMNAKLPDGKPIELKMPFTVDGLGGLTVGKKPSDGSK